MSEDGTATDDGGLAAGAASMRESAKWLVGGVAATAAGVFAGSSLTNLGSLDPFDQPWRLGAALVGAVIGFLALGCIVRRAIAVLTVGSVTFRMLADAQSGLGDAALKPLAVEVATKYPIPLSALSLGHLMVKTAALPDGDSRLAEVRTYTDNVLRDAAFLSVRKRFDRLASTLSPATAFAILGFGLFAWAANPPAERAPGPEPLLTVYRG